MTLAAVNNSLYLSNPSVPRCHSRVAQAIHAHFASDEQIVEITRAFLKSSRPASFAAMASLPRARVLPIHREQFKHDETQCSICCERLIDGVMLVRLPCGHVFHNCIMEWLTKCRSCPDCRFTVSAKGLSKSATATFPHRMNAFSATQPSLFPDNFAIDPASS